MKKLTAHSSQRTALRGQLSAVNSRRTAGSKGFTVLMAALVSSIALALGLSVFGLAQKEITLSALGRDSQLAFYAADTGAECALYWDMRFGSFVTTTPPAEIVCDGQGAPVTTTHHGGEGAWQSTDFVFRFESRGYAASGYCSQLTVTKSKPLGDGGAASTTIHADGFSVACGSLTSSRALQRSVELLY